MVMRTAGFLAFLCAFTLTLSTIAFAKAKNEGSFDLTQVANLGSVQLQPGHYKAEWTGTNGNVNLDIMHNGKTVVTTKAELKELSSPAAYSAVTLRTTRNHNKRIEEIQFNNRKDALFLTARAS
jgi:hypothetical protein